DGNVLARASRRGIVDRGGGARGLARATAGAAGGACAFDRAGAVGSLLRRGGLEVEVGVSLPAIVFATGLGPSHDRRVMNRFEPSRPSPRVVQLLVAVGVLALSPWLARLYASGEWAGTARETWASIVASAVAIGFGVWVVVLLRREREITRRHLDDLEGLPPPHPPT